MAARKRKLDVPPEVKEFALGLLGDMAGRAIQGAAEVLFERTEAGLKTILGTVTQAHETVKRPTRKPKKSAPEELVGEVVESASKH